MSLNLPDENFIPIALACGHVVQTQATFRYTPGEGTKIDCPEGCGWPRYVVDPSQYTPCGCEHPFNHTCGREAIILDLGVLDAGDTTEIDFDEPS